MVFPLKPPFITYFPLQIFGYPSFWTLSQFSHRCRADTAVVLKAPVFRCALMKKWRWRRTTCPGIAMSWIWRNRGKIMEQSKWHGKMMKHEDILRIDMGIYFLGVSMAQTWGQLLGCSCPDSYSHSTWDPWDRWDRGFATDPSHHGISNIYPHWYSVRES